MKLLELDRVAKAYGRGTNHRHVLREVSLAIHPGEVVAVWGPRRSGRTTLLRIAAGLEAPDGGVVRLQGRDLVGPERERLRREIGYVRRTFDASDGRNVLEQIVVAQLARGVRAEQAGALARDALARVNAEHCARLRANELSIAESVRAGIARSLAARPRLLAIDEPTLGVDALERDGVLALLRALADEDGVAILASTDRGVGLAGTDRALSLSGGVLRGALAPQLARVVALRRPIRQSA
jgi:putative ABC transport system ATP-binding protein